MASPLLSFLPAPLGIFEAFGEILTFTELSAHILPSILRVLLALLISAAIGLPVGYFSSRNGFIARILTHTVSAIRYVPPTALIGLIIIAFGIGNNAALVLITFGIAPYVALMTADAFRAVPRNYIEVALVFQASQLELFKTVYWPFILPRFVESLRVNVGAAWTLLVIAELVAGNSGIGYLIARAQRYLDMDKLYALVILSGILGMVFDRLIFIIVRSTSWWQRNDDY
jgi:NitT/TauT family transport system permease protein